MRIEAALRVRTRDGLNRQTRPAELSSVISIIQAMRHLSNSNVLPVLKIGSVISWSALASGLNKLMDL
jgi:hypothetical protein